MRPTKAIALATPIIWLLCTHWQPAVSEPAGLDVTYLGNEGFLVRSGPQAVLFDALFGNGLPEYDRVPVAIAHDIETGKSPFTNINALLISHIHRDHFDVKSTLRFLESHRTTVVVAPGQVAERIRNAFGGNSQAVSRVHSATLKQSSIAIHDEDGIQIGSFPLEHGDVENAAYLVSIGGRTVLHFGDADLPIKDLAKFGLANRHIDIAFVPFWQLTENAQTVRTQIAAKVVIPMHIITNPTSDASKAYLAHVGGRDGMVRRIRSTFPNAAIFLIPLKTKTF